MRYFIVGIASIAAGVAAIARPSLGAQPGITTPELRPEVPAPKPNPAAPTPPGTADKPTDKPADGTVELISPGEERDRRVLRIVSKGATTSRYRVSTSRLIESGQPGGTWQTLVEQDFAAAMTVTHDAGVARDERTKVTISNVQTNTTAGVDTQALRKSMSVTTAAIVENLTLSGVSFAKNRKPPAAGAKRGAATGGTAEGLTEVVSNAMIPLPTEAVGMGASWRVRTIEKKAGLSIPTTATYTVTELHPDHVVLKIGIAENLQSQTVPDAKARDGAVWLSYSSNAAGTAVLMLDAPVALIHLDLMGAVEVTGVDLDGKPLASLKFESSSIVEPPKHEDAESAPDPEAKDAGGEEPRISLPMLPSSSGGKRAAPKRRPK